MAPTPFRNKDPVGHKPVDHKPNFMGCGGLAQQGTQEWVPVNSAKPKEDREEVGTPELP